MAADSEVSYAAWADPRSAFTIQYSLPLFHEIDFQVNEGYRRIPHGGVEVGGLLYGRTEDSLVTIEAFRPIECEHASGPSFQLSEADLAKLSDSIRIASQEEELQGLRPLGWFISHTRSALQMTEREVQLFGRFFPEAGRVTILIKPERFKPTRFSFLVRQTDGVVHPDGTENAVILPLPGRAGKTGSEIAAALPAPIEMPRRESVKTEDPFVSPYKEAPVKPLPDVAVETPSSPVSFPDAALKESPTVLPATPLLSPARPAQAPRPIKKKSQTGLLLTLLLFAAAVGCAAGYWAYLQLPPATITLRTQKRQDTLLVMWDPAQTRSATYSAIRVDDGTPVLLTNDQRLSGIAQIPLKSDNLKVELLAHQWAIESRGIIRYLRMPSKSPAVNQSVP